MPIISINGVPTNINPTSVELGTYQKHGLGPTDRKPNDYLRMVARTFSSFRNTPTKETVVSYINGFDVTVNEESVPAEFPTDPDSVYNLFKIKAGACMIDNQLIDIYEDTYFILENINFVPGTKYGIVIEYDYIEQRQDNAARIRFITYDSLHFPRVEDKNVVSCDFSDISLDGNSSTTEFSGKPGLLIATFATSIDGDVDGKDRQIVQSNPAIPGSLIPGIDPQYLSKLYIQNYKLLFEYFGNQSRAIYSAMGMTNANFISVAPQQIYKSENPELSEEENLRSGDMCYFDESSNTYKRSIASRQKFSQIVGLYLNEYNEGNHLIYTGGFIACDAIKHNLPYDHQLLTMEPGSHYFLEDSASLFDTQNQIRTIDNYVLADSSGRISNRYYPGSVRVGYATACNQLILDIDHSAEIGTQNLISLFGTYDEYLKEYVANDKVIKLETYNDTLTTQNFELENLINESKTMLGDNLAANVNAFCTNYSGTSVLYAFTYLLYDILIKYFHNGFNAKSIYKTELDWSSIDMDEFDVAQQTDIRTKILEYGNLKNIKNLLNESTSDINILLVAKQTELSNFLTNFKLTGGTNQDNVLDLQLQIARYKLGDHPTVINNFENWAIKNDNFQNYDGTGSPIETLEGNVDVILDDQQLDADSYFAQVTEINKLKSMLNESQSYINKLSELIIAETERNIKNELTIANNNAQIASNIVERNQAAGNIMNSDSNKLDIFQMDDYQRTIFNYTYITDRLQKRLLLVDSLSTDLVKAQTLYEAVHNNDESTLIEQVSALGEVNRIENFIQSNSNFIKNYTEEYNKIRFELGLPAIVKGDVNFDDLGLANQRIGTYRYGCDDFETTYGGLATNLISVPCGPYTSADGFIIPKNSSEMFIDVILNDGHSQGDIIHMHSVDVANHGTSRLVTKLLFTLNVLADTDYENYTLYDNNMISVPFIVENNTIYIMIDGNVDLSGYILRDSTDAPINGTITIKEGIAYIPENNYSGNDIFSYSIIDDDGKIAIGTVTVEVTGPYTTPDYTTVAVNSATNIIDVLANDGHTGGERIIIMSATPTEHGTLSVVQGNVSIEGEITYTPNVDYIGNDYFEYIITDGVITVVDSEDVSSGAVATGRVYITVQ